MTRFGWVVAAVLVAQPLTAQEPWKSSYFPYVMGNPGDGVMFLARWQRTQNAPYFLSKTDAEDVVNPITFRGAVSAEIGIGTLGSRVGRIEFRAPGLKPGWRFHASVGAERAGRYGYYGLGRDLEQADGTADPNANRFRVERTRYVARAEVTRTLGGPVRLALGAFFDRTGFSAVDGTTLFGSRFANPVRRTNLTIRPALIYDSRDHEFTPSNGVLGEVGAGAGSGRESPLGVRDDQSWHGFAYAHVRGYLSLREGTVLAGRVLALTREGRAPLSALGLVPGWEREFNLAGADGHRSFPAGAIAGTDVELLSVEIRHDLLNAGDLGAVSVFGFVDYAGFEDSRSILLGRTTQFGGGAGVAFRVLRSAVLTTNFAAGKHGFNFSMGTGWSF
jgi:hypothetical protein